MHTLPQLKIFENHGMEGGVDIVAQIIGVVKTQHHFGYEPPRIDLLLTQCQECVDWF